MSVCGARDGASAQRFCCAPDCCHCSVLPEPPKHSVTSGSQGLLTQILPRVASSAVPAFSLELWSSGRVQPQGCVLCFRKFRGKIYIYMYFLLGSSLLALLQWLLLLFSALVLCGVWMQPDWSRGVGVRGGHRDAGQGWTLGWAGLSLPLLVSAFPLDKGMLWKRLKGMQVRFFRHRRQCKLKTMLLQAIQFHRVKRVWEAAESVPTSVNICVVLTKLFVSQNQFNQGAFVIHSTLC